MYKRFSKIIVNARSSTITIKQLSRRLSVYGDDKPPNVSGESDKGKLKDKRIRLPGVTDTKNIWNVLNYEFEADINDMIPRECDVLIIGGGIIGWSAAFFLKLNTTLNVLVVERDPSHTRSATVLGIGAIRQQFSEPENIQMSLFGAEFLRNVREHLSILDLDPPDIQFHPHGFLTLASEKGAEQLKKCYEVQKSLGAKVELLTRHDLRSIWPWMAVDDVGAAIHGYENEGWFDQWQLLNALKRKASSLGAQQVVGEVVGFEFEEHQSGSRPDLLRKGPPLRKPVNALVRLVTGHMQPIHFAFAVNAAGPWAAAVGRLLGMGEAGGPGGSLPLPVEPRVQHVFVVSPAGTGGGGGPPGPGVDCPFLVDYDGLNLRRDRLGGDFLLFLDPPALARAPLPPAAPLEDPMAALAGLSVDFAQFEARLRPQLARRVPGLAAAAVRSGWASLLDHNYLDRGLLLGPHPSMRNLLFACGSSGHGIEHSLAIGRALFELIAFADFQTIDLRNCGLERIYEQTGFSEKERF